MRMRFNDVATVAMVFCSLAVAAMAVKRQLSPSDQPRKERQLPTWEPLSDGGHRRGVPNAPVSIVEFADFQCGACERVRFSLDTLLIRRKDVSVTYRHYPLRMIHPYSEAASNAAECAAEQGRFFEYANVLFDKQNQIATEPWSRFAVESHIGDTLAFNRCVTARRHQTSIDRDQAVADSVGILGTPTLIINGKVITGGLSLVTLDREVTDAMKRARKRG